MRLTRTVVETRLGKPFADALDAPFVTLLGDTLSRREVVDHLQLANLVAVVRLSKALKRLRITTPAQLAAVDPMSLYRMKGVGTTQVFVAMCVLDAHGFDPVSWWDNFDHKPKRRANARKEDVE